MKQSKTMSAILLANRYKPTSAKANRAEAYMVDVERKTRIDHSTPIIMIVRKKIKPNGIKVKAHPPDDDIKHACGIIEIAPDEFMKLKAALRAKKKTPGWEPTWSVGTRLF